MLCAQHEAPNLICCVLDLTPLRNKAEQIKRAVLMDPSIYQHLPFTHFLISSQNIKDGSHMCSFQYPSIQKSQHISMHLKITVMQLQI